MDAAKIRLSATEMELVTNAGWILTKNGIIRKAQLLLAALQEEISGYLKSYSSPLTMDANRIPPKISKGENYNGLPYLMLDYPRLFDKENIFAIRTMFWWGNFFSITLHLCGSYKTLYAKECIAAFEILAARDFYVCIHTDEWEHHFDESNYIPVKNLLPSAWEKMIPEKRFIKIARKHPLDEWDAVIGKLMDDFKVLIDVLESRAIISGL